MRHIRQELSAFAATAVVKISVGIDVGGTSVEGLQMLLDAVRPQGGEVWVFRNEDFARPTFHPKIYVFERPGDAIVFVGSGNLTSGGLFTNYEATVCLRLALSEADDAALLREVTGALDAWCDPGAGLALPLTPELLEQLERDGLVVRETRAQGDERNAAAEAARERSGTLESPFGRQRIPRAPRAPAIRGAGPDTGLTVLGFAMTLQRTDVGRGQTTPGAGRRSPEVFIPLVARNEYPEFWAWPHGFVEDPRKPDKWDRSVFLRFRGDVVEAHLMTWPDRHDLRLRSEAIVGAGRIGDILRLEKCSDDPQCEYHVVIVGTNTPEHSYWLTCCDQRVRQANSRKRYGYY
jgi:hypothetical protein